MIQNHLAQHHKLNYFVLYVINFVSPSRLKIYLGNELR